MREHPLVEYPWCSCRWCVDRSQRGWQRKRNRDPGRRERHRRLRWAGGSARRLRRADTMSG
eukprot:3739256-Amphidinium_carterae.1